MSSLVKPMGWTRRATLQGAIAEGGSAECPPWASRTLRGQSQPTWRTRDAC